MDFSWLESTFHTSRPLKKEDCIVTFLHWMLLRNGFRVLHSKEGQLKVRDVEGKEVLPESWNKDSVYELHYLKDGHLHTMIAVIIDGKLAITIVRMKDEKVANLVLDTDTIIGSDFQSFGEAFKARVGLYSVIEKDLMTTFIEKVAPSKPVESESSTRRARTTPPEQPSKSPFPDLFAVGGGELETSGRGIGGVMQMNPRDIGELRNQPVIPQNLPLGAVPPYASEAKEEKENADKASTEGILKTVDKILDNLTRYNFDAFLTKIQALDIESEDRLAGVIKLFFEKAVDEPIFSPVYAKMCQSLSTKEVASASNPSEVTNFRKLLLTRCQKEFEKDSAGLIEVENKKKEIEIADSEAKKKELETELEELVNSNRRKSLGNIRFIGELFKLRILSVKIIHQCILRLLSQPENEASLECLCTLLSTIGKELDTPMPVLAGRTASVSANRESMNSYFSTLDSIVNKRNTSNRIRLMIQKVVDLRKTGWKLHDGDNNPKTIDQIHKEREEQERELNNPQFRGNMGGPSRDGRMGDRRGGDDRNRKQSRSYDDGWNTVQNSGSRSNLMLHMKQLRIHKASGDADQSVISLGLGGKRVGSWRRGASGGMSRDKAPLSGRSSLGGPPQSGRGGNQDYRTMPGATKSAFFPPKDGGKKGLDSLRSLGFADRSRSQQSSRGNSVTRPIRETPQPPTLSREVSKDVHEEDDHLFSGVDEG